MSLEFPTRAQIQEAKLVLTLGDKVWANDEIDEKVALEIIEDLDKIYQSILYPNTYNENNKKN